MANRNRNRNNRGEQRGHQQQQSNRDERPTVSDRFKAAAAMTFRAARAAIEELRMGPEDVRNMDVLGFGSCFLPKVRRYMDGAPGDDCGLLAWTARGADDDRGVAISEITRDPLPIGPGIVMLREIAARSLTCKIYDVLQEQVDSAHRVPGNVRDISERQAVAG